MRNRIICLTFVLASCGIMEPRMSSVMEDCDTRSDFSRYVSCIKSEYQRDRSAQSVRSFYVQLDAIKEDYENGALSNTKARAAAYRAYDQTVGAENARIDANAYQTNTSIVNKTYNNNSKSDDDVWGSMKGCSKSATGSIVGVCY